MKRLTYPAVVFLLVLVVFTAAGCSGRQTGEDSEKLKVYTTIYPLYDFTVNVGGDRVDVRNLTPPGAEPHEWEPAPRDLAALTAGDVLVYCGAGLEPWAGKFLKNTSGSKLVAVNASVGISLQEADGDNDEHGHEAGGKEGHGSARVDPHVWLDPLLAKQMVDNIKKGLSGVDPAGRDYYETNAARYKEELDRLDAEYRAALEKAPRKAFVTSHAAFGYLTRRYGLRQIPIRGISPEVEPTPSRIAEIVKLARQEDIRYVFFESMVNPKISEVIAAETGARVMVLNPLGSLTRDEIDAGKNYLAVMRENLNNLKAALGVNDEP